MPAKASWCRVEAPHDARPAPGTGPVKLAVTLVIDKGTAPRNPGY